MNLLLSSRGLVDKMAKDSFLALAPLPAKISIITTASLEFKEKNRNTIALRKELDAMGYLSQFIDVEFDNLDLLVQAEAIIITGGNPYYLLHHLKESGADRILRRLITENIPIWGISAGVFILMKDLEIVDHLTPEMNSIGLHNKECLGVINEVVIPHFDRFIKDRIITKSKVDNFESKCQTNIVRLGEYQFMKYSSSGFEIVGKLMSLENPADNSECKGL